MEINKNGVNKNLWRFKSWGTHNHKY